MTERQSEKDMAVRRLLGVKTEVERKKEYKIFIEPYLRRNLGRCEFKWDGNNLALPYEKMLLLQRNSTVDDLNALLALADAAYNVKDYTRAEFWLWMMETLRHDLEVLLEIFHCQASNEGQLRIASVKTLFRWQEELSIIAGMDIGERLGKICRREGDVYFIDDDMESALPWLELGACNGNSECACFLYNMYLAGTRVEQDPDEAEKWLKIMTRNNFALAEKGNPNAIRELACQYERGKGVEMSMEQAEKFYHRSYEIFLERAKEGDAEAQCDVADMIYLGTGTDYNPEAAEKWFLKAMEGGSTTAKEHYGDFCIAMCNKIMKEEKSTRNSIKKLIQWLRKAADAGNQSGLDFMRNNPALAAMD